MTTKVVQLTKDDIKEFTSVVGQAFAQDPLFIKLFSEVKSDVKKQRQIRAFLYFLFSWCYYREEPILGVYQNDKLVAAALIETEKNFSWARLIKQFLIAPTLINLLYQLPFNKGQFLNQYFLKTRQAISIKPHYYLTMIATLPVHQGQGLARLLIDDITARAEQEFSVKGIALDTENHSNISFYQTMGFELINECAIDDVSVFSLFKANKSH